MGQVLPLNAEERRVLESGALLHDIGLVGVPRHMIRRWADDPQLLNPAEKALIETHPILGQELAPFTSNLDKVGQIIRAHHERFDGGAIRTSWWKTYRGWRGCWLWRWPTRPAG